MVYRYSQVLGTPGQAPRGSARQQIYTSLRGTGQDIELLGKAALVGVTAPTGTMVSCNMYAGKLADILTKQLQERGLLHLSAPITGVSDGVLNGHENMGFSLHSRNEIAGQVGFSSDQYRPDAHVGLFACDKTGPGLVMGYSTLKYSPESQRGTVPSVMMYAGSTIPGFCHLKEDQIQRLEQKLKDAGIIENGHDIVTGFKVEAGVKAGIITPEEGEMILRHTVEEVGACQGMYTANTMSVALEVLGMTAPDSSNQVITDDRIIGMIIKTVDCVETCIRDNITPNKIINETSIRNALGIINALGASTNAVLHFKALTKRFDIDVSNQFLNDIRRSTPLVGNLKSFGQGNMVDFIKNGDLKTLLRRMVDGKYLDGNTLTVTGKSLGDNIETMESRSTGNTLLSSFESPIMPQGNLAILEGNLADHAVMKVTAEQEKYFKGPAIVFDNEQDAIQGILGGQVEDGMVVVIRFVGPVAAGIPEMLSPTSLIKAKNLKVSLISDGRFSGGSYGAVVGHISPEAAIGGPIGKLKTGDIIEIDSENGTINVVDVNLDKREAAAGNDRRDAYHPVKQKASLIGQASEGADYISK